MSVCIGIDLGGTKISGVALDAAGRELVRLRIPSPRDDYAASVATIAELTARLEAEAGVAPGAVSVGVGTPGTWQPRLQCMKNCNSAWLNDRPLLHDLRGALGERVRIANDADCLALSETTDGAAAGAGSVFAVILGTGVGGGVVIGGRLHQGPNGLAGEWGHTPLPYLRQPVRAPTAPAEEFRLQMESRLQDRRCYCSRLNCIESFLSGPGLAAMHWELVGVEAGAEAIAARGSPATQDTWEVYLDMAARSLAQVVNLLDPEVIVVGGGLSNALGLCEDLAMRIPPFAFSSIRASSERVVSDDVQVRVRRAQWGDDSGVRGAARLCMESSP